MLPVLVSNNLHCWFCSALSAERVYVSTNISKNFPSFSDILLTEDL